MTRQEIMEQLGCTESELEALEKRLQEDHERFLRENEERAKAMKFRKVRNEEMWIAQNGTTIRYNHFFGQYDINRGTFFEFAKTLNEAMDVARHSSTFNR